MLLPLLLLTLIGIMSRGTRTRTTRRGKEEDKDEAAQGSVKEREFIVFATPGLELPPPSPTSHPTMAGIKPEKFELRGDLGILKSGS